MSKSYSAYVYPNIHRSRMDSNNPYVENLKCALCQNGLTINLSPAKSALLDLIKNGFRSDLIVLNWIENVPSNKFGILQTLVLIIYFNILKSLRVKIIWVRHNKQTRRHRRITLHKVLESALRLYSDHIIQHSLDVAPNLSGKVIFMQHPNKVNPGDILSPTQEESAPIDFLIWGTLLPYKGVLEFLRLIARDAAFGKFNIHIVGKCPDKNYWRALVMEKTDNVRIVNKYVEKYELKELFRMSRFILFTYRKDSVLSSGVLIDSLLAGKRIIAPDCGAFRDIAESHGFVSIYGDLTEISEIYVANYHNYILDQSELKDFLIENSWQKMGEKLKALI